MSDPIVQTDPLRLVNFMRQHAPELDAPTVTEPEAQLVSFNLGTELFALAVEQVREVVRVQSLTRIPQAPEHVRGVQNLRGRVLPVLEVKTRLGLPPAELTANSRVLVVEGHGRLLGLLVDAVQRVAPVPVSKIQPPPKEVRSPLSEHVVAMAELGFGLALVLDVNRLLVLPTLET